VHKHLFVFLEPCIRRGPVEPDRAAKSRDRGVSQQPGRAGPDDLAGPQRMHLECATPALLAVPLRDKKVTAHVREGVVVLRVIRPFPHIQRPRCVQDLLTRQERADATRYGFDVVNRGDHHRIVVHCEAPLGLLAAPLTLGAGETARQHMSHFATVRWAPGAPEKEITRS